ncbi:MAG: class I SAM-dependent rRNA methyltransferase [Thermogemmatispora sp.]|uniref:class I SAM-dependent rRNA methyltransferase n=1 Tax=Thermogemmatispora sp. TaxID=1968838 RepID=UPI001A062BCF|nr:class I SAM-dependent rRNA methyltransferase [Thermogemmatispora sp.]MBE3565896.1 class I SAM-dependent rRNA methyltransferase [Thermogemmatispora sp.]
MSTTTVYPQVRLKPQREEPLLNGHLWVFSGALQQVPREVEPGGLVEVRSASGQFLGRGYYHPHTDIAVRLLTRREEPIDAALLRRRIRRAQELRRVFDPAVTNIYRLIHSEGDGLPGLIVDRYAEVLVAQVHTLGMERLLPLLVEPLLEETGARGLLLRNDSQARRREGLALEEPRLLAGEVPPEVEGRENGVRYLIDPWRGQKTGFFLDQRDKRAALAKYVRAVVAELAPEGVARVLNCFSYTGGFSLVAALSDGRVRVTSVDSSQSAMEAARRHFALNGLDADQHAFVVADVFAYLEEVRARGERFDIVVLDPPAFARNQGARSQALRAYRRLNMLGMSVLRPAGILLSCSCSGVIGLDDLSGTLSLAARALDREVQVLEVLTHSCDHPVRLAMPETLYLKAIFCRLLW